MRRRIEAMTRERSMILACTRSRRRSRKRYPSRMSSGYSASLLTGNGSGSAADSTSCASMTSSTSPVGKAGLIVSGRRFDDLAGDRHDAFEPQPVHLREKRRRDVDDALRDAVMVAQIDEQQLAVIALPVHPAGKPSRAPASIEAEGAASVGSIGVHQTGPAHSGEGAEHGTDSRLLSRSPGRTKRRFARSRFIGKNAVRVLSATVAAEKDRLTPEIPAIPCDFPDRLRRIPASFPAWSAKSAAIHRVTGRATKHQGKFPC